MNTEHLKKPMTWAVAVPALLALWTLVAGWQMLGVRKEADNEAYRAGLALKSAKYILTAQGQADAAAARTAERQEFDGIASARHCARAGRIAEQRVVHGDSSTPRVTKEKRLQHRETYKLSGITLVQCAQFVNAAENDFLDLRCTSLAVKKARGDEKDRWDVEVTLEYFTDAK